MLCYRCGSHVPDTSDSCATCGLKLAGAARRRPGLEAPFRPGEVFAGRYAIREVLGAGPVGHVFRALDQERDVEVALKVINPKLVQMPEERTQFSLAIRAGTRLSHPHHVRVYEAGEDKGRPYFTTQLLEGPTLRRVMEQRAAQGQRFTPREVEQLLAGLAEALDSAHKFGPHSNLKPENVFVLPDLLKVTDHGLALGIPRLPFIQSQKGWKVGCYVAPEYVDGGELDTRMDLYSLGVIMGELLTGLTPEDGEVPELPPALESLYRRTLHANPLVRPGSAGELLAEFSAALAPPKPAAPRAPVKGSLGFTVEMALGLRGEVNKSAPPVPTLELPSLAPPTVQMPAMVFPADDSAARAVTLLEAPVSAPPTVEVARAASPTEQVPSVQVAPWAVTREAPVDATQPMNSAEVLARLPAPAAAPTVPARPALRAVPAPPVRRSRFKGGLALLVLVGLGLGAAGGYGFSRRRASESPAPPVAPAGPAKVVDSLEVVPVGQCPAGMRLVSGGTFKMGSESSAEGGDELPLIHTQVASFCVDELEFPNHSGALPQAGATWHEAKAACEKLGKRLCTEAEWEKACKGPGNARFPYGNPFDAAACNTGGSALAASGSFARCLSGYGVGDLSGNLAEWTSTRYGEGLELTQKGGAFNGAESGAGCASRKSGDPTRQSPTVGFRCCAGVGR